MVGVIDRRTLESIAEDAIDTAELAGKTVTEEDVQNLNDVAQTAEQLALGSWDINPECGCLVGTMLMSCGMDPAPWRAFEDEDERADALYFAGVVFDDLLRAALQGRMGGVRMHTGIVQVID